MQRFTAVIGNPSSLYIPDCSEEPGRSNQQITQMNGHLKKDINSNMRINALLSANQLKTKGIVSGVPYSSYNFVAFDPVGSRLTES